MIPTCFRIDASGQMEVERWRHTVVMETKLVVVMYTGHTVHTRQVSHAHHHVGSKLLVPPPLCMACLQYNTAGYTAQCNVSVCTTDRFLRNLRIGIANCENEFSTFRKLCEKVINMLKTHLNSRCYWHFQLGCNVAWLIVNSSVCVSKGEVNTGHGYVIQASELMVHWQIQLDWTWWIKPGWCSFPFNLIYLFWKCLVINVLFQLKFNWQYFFPPKSHFVMFYVEYRKWELGILKVTFDGNLTWSQTCVQKGNIYKPESDAFLGGPLLFVCIKINQSRCEIEKWDIK